mmetsp:Transcript_48773/g.123713  ORF Transcript_48773/g.123713 Transcript_48773/m.123713 type:complete len:298 (+) Transcript_48773:47-940(+)
MAASQSPQLPPETAPPPAVVNDQGLRWVRTEIKRGADLVDGGAWVAAFAHRLTAAQAQVQAQSQAAQAQAGGSAGGEGVTLAPRRRLLRQVATDGDAPQFWGSSGDAPLVLRNEVLRQMAPEFMWGTNADPSKGPGRKVCLATGEEVIFWFNVGKPGQPRERVYVTSAHCPHQNVCLNTGELKDIEDIVGNRRAMIRCPRHNKTFDLKTGECPGNKETLQVYPSRFEHGHWYVATGPADTVDAALPVCADVHIEADAEMEDVEEPASKRSRAEQVPFWPLPPTPASVRRLTPCLSMT